MMSNNCAFNVIAILINLFCEDIDMLANFVKMPLGIPLDVLYFPFFSQYITW